MKIGVLTSSRADFGIYLPLLKRMIADPFFKVELIAFGTHLSHFHGYSIQQILEEGFHVPHRIESLVLGDTPEAVSTAMGTTSLKFSSFWASHGGDYDLVLCLGDRYEMCAAVIAAVPFGIKFAHFHGGETTLGAIDNIFRHAITLCATYHFASTQEYALRIQAIIDRKENIHVIGAMSLDNLISMDLLSQDEFLEAWAIDLRKPTILVTLHPETVDISLNEDHAATVASVLNELSQYQVVVTMPNTDASGSVIRNVWQRELTDRKRIFFVENFGTKGYFSCMKFCAFMLGNTSSGIIEAASFSKYVINVGDRQKGRAHGDNVINASFERNEILGAVKKILKLPALDNTNVYWAGGAVEKTITILKAIKA